MKKLISTEKNKLTNDKRSKLISLTPAAAELLDEFISNIQNIIGEHIKDVSEEDAKTLGEAVRKIIEIMNLDGGLYNETRT